MVDKNNRIAKLLNIILNCVILAGVLFTLKIGYEVINMNFNDVSNVLIYLVAVLLVIGVTCVFLVVFNLKKIVITLINGNPFIKENAVALKNISIECFIIASCYIVNNFINIVDNNFRLVYIDSLGIHTDIEFAIFLFAGLFILVLSQVFDKAVSYKEETDFMI